MLLAFLIIAPYKFASFEYYREGVILPRNEVIKLVESKSEFKSEYAIGEKFSLYMYPLERGYHLAVLYYSKDEQVVEEQEKLVEIGQRIAQGDPQAINHVLSDFQMPL